MPEPSRTAGAVFLSYASQDAEAAKRICEALRQAGVEVWFDQSELVGGDQWDGKIRGQISSCALFMPIISASTQARLEGYFRLEWKLAAQRTHTMADEKAFLMPIVIDGTRDAEAKVPAEFKSVQWTKLPGGETPGKFCERVKKLLGDEPVGADSRRDSPEPSRDKPAPTKKRKFWLVPVILTAVFAGLWQQQRNREPAPATEPKAAVPAAAALTEAQKLVAQARVVYDNGDELNRENIFFADDLVKRALVLDPADPAAWELAAWLSYTMSWQGFDNSDARRETLMRQAARALALAPSSVSAQLVMINARTTLNFASSGWGPNKVVAESERELLALAAREPGNWQVQRALGQTYRFLNRPDDCIPALRRAVELSQGKASAVVDLVNVLVRLKRYDEAEAIIAPTLAREPTGRVLAFDLLIKCRWRGDLTGAQAALQTWPSWLLQEDRGAFWAWQAWIYSRQPDKALAAALRLQRDYLRDANFTGPRAVLTARAHELSGHAEAARAEWRTVVQVTDRELAGNPDDPAALYWKTWALTRLGETAAAQVNGTLLRQRTQSNQMSFFKGTNIAALWVTVGQAELAFQSMNQQLKEFNDSYGVTRAMLELDPAYDPVRDDPRFKEIVALAPAPKSQTQDPGPSSPPLVDSKSVAVLAFANLSDDKGNEYFSDGISEELLNVLAKVPQLKVAARTSSFYFKGRNEPIPEIAQKLGVAYVVEGSVRKAGNKVRVTAQLIKAADGFHVWSETYDRDLTDIFAVQDEIAKNILGVVKGSLMGAADLPHATTTNIEAYTLYLQAQGQFATRSDAGLHEAVRLFEAALQIDPDYVPALVGLAFARVVLPSYVSIFGSEARALFEGAKQAAQRALELDPRNTGALTVIGCVLYTAEWRWKEGEAVMLRARASAPHDALVENFIGDYFRWTGANAQAVAAKRLALELDPLRAGSFWDLGYTYLAAKDYDQALHWGELTLKMAPHNLDPYYLIIMAAAHSGRYDLMRQTIAAARQNVHENDGLRLMLEAHAAILAKNPDEARRILAAATALVERGEASPAYLGYCHLLLGESEQAMRWMQRGYDLRDIVITWSENIDFDVIAANPVTRPILDRPGLKELYELRQRNARAGLNKL